MSMRKNFLENNVFKKLLNGSFWFEDENLNVAEKEIVVETSNEEEKREVYEQKIRTDYEALLMAEKRLEEKLVEEKEDSENINNFTERPTGYIDLYLINLTADELFLKHNITLQYLDIKGKKYIKEIRLGNQGRELDCFAEGENRSIAMEKISSTQLVITLEEISGNIEKVIIINGRLVS